jgi:hypothetical protein
MGPLALKYFYFICDKGKKLPFQPFGYVPGRSMWPAVGGGCYEIK